MIDGGKVVHHNASHDQQNPHTHQKEAHPAHSAICAPVASVAPGVLHACKVEGRGTGAAVAEWLEGQAESVLFIAKQLQEVKTKPRAVMGALHSYAVAMSEETGKTMYQMAMEGEPAASEAKDLLRQIFGVKEAGTSIGGAAGSHERSAVPQPFPVSNTESLRREHKYRQQVRENPMKTAIDWLSFRTKTDPFKTLEALQPIFGTAADLVTFVPGAKGRDGWQRAGDVLMAGDIKLGWIDYGGESQRGWVRVQLYGEGCQWVQDWQAVEQLGEALQG